MYKRLRPLNDPASRQEAQGYAASEGAGLCACMGCQSAAGTYPTQWLPDIAATDPACARHDFAFDEPLDLDLLSNWLGSVAFFHGAQVLRLQGRVFIQGEDLPFEIHSQGQGRHTLLPLALTGGQGRVSRLEFITRDLPRSTIETALEQTRQALACAEPH